MRGGEEMTIPGTEVPVVPIASADDVNTVYEFWLTTMEKNPNRVKLTDARRKKIARAIKDYGVEVCKDAILGCSISDFHMGKNPGKKVYNDIELILRDAPHIERFSEDWERHNKPRDPLAGAARSIWDD